LFLRLLWKSPSSVHKKEEKLLVLPGIGKTVGIVEESINRNEKCLWISLDVGRRTSRLSMKPILLVARSLTSVIPLQTNVCTPSLWFWSRTEVYCKRKVLCTKYNLAPSFSLRNANWKRLQSKIVSSIFWRTLHYNVNEACTSFQDGFLLEWFVFVTFKCFGNICRPFPRPKMISEGDYVILKKENVIRAVKVRKGR